MNIIDAIIDANLFRPFLGDLESWSHWLTAMKVLYGLPIESKAERKLIRQCTGRKAKHLPPDGFDTALFLIGRRSGKSRMAAIAGAYEAALAGHEEKLATGEVGVVPIISPSKKQSRIVRDYIRAIFDQPMLRKEIEKEDREGFELRSETRIEILVGDWRTVRGYTLLAAIVDEAAFLGWDSESKVKSDTELIRAIKPSLATVNGKLIAISSPYAMKGWCYTSWKRHFGNNASNVLVWNCGSRVMNPTLRQSVVDDAMAEDLQAAKSEYLGEFRDDVAAYLPRVVIEAVVVRNREELLPRSDRRYWAFADLSGGRRDDAALSIAHTDERCVVVDLVRRWRPPFNPHAVIGEMAKQLKDYRCRHVVGDNYSAEFVASSFKSHNVRYVKCDKPKAELYRELLPRIGSGEIELPDIGILVDQLAGLERRTRSGGKDIIDHPAGGHDDVANAVAGVAAATSIRTYTVGAL